jgi:hypothetical protein
MAALQAHNAAASAGGFKDVYDGAATTAATASEADTAAAAAAAAATPAADSSSAGPSPWLSAAAPTRLSLKRESAADRQLLINVLVHSADLSGQMYAAPTAAVWEARITQEFRQQAAEEVRLGMTPAPFMQNLDTPRVRAKLQVDFIDYVLTPWWCAVVALFPMLQPCLDNMRANRACYEAVANGPVLPDEGAANAKSAAAGV